MKNIFQQKANPCAPEYRPEIWNDCDILRFSSLTLRHRTFLDNALDALEWPRNVWTAGLMLHRFDDSRIAELSGFSQDRVKAVRDVLQPLLSSTILSTNCYAYALNLRRGFIPGAMAIPGQLIERGEREPGRYADFGCTGDLIEGIKRDGITLFEGNPCTDSAPEGFYFAYLHTRSSSLLREISGDFHFFRQDREGFSHKRGHNPVTCMSAPDTPITNPLQDDLVQGYKYQATLLVPADMPQRFCPA